MTDTPDADPVQIAEAIAASRRPDSVALISGFPYTVLRIEIPGHDALTIAAELFRDAIEKAKRP
jgi:hypothetical protein